MAERTYSTAYIEYTNSPYVRTNNIYLLNAEEMKLFINALYAKKSDLSSGLFKDPLGGILSLKYFPFDPSIMYNNLVQSANIRVGTVELTATASQVFGGQNSLIRSIDCGRIDLTDLGSSYLDYSPYLRMSLYLPHIGFVDIDTNMVVGNVIYIRYGVDAYTGTCQVFLETTVKTETGNHQVVFQTVTGTIGTSIPFGGSDLRQTQANMAMAGLNSIGSLAAGTAGVFSGNPIAAVGGISSLAGTAGTLMSASGEQIRRGGVASPCSAVFGPNIPYLIMNRITENAGDYSEYIGNQCASVAKLGDLTGFTSCTSVHLDGVIATSSELDEIRDLLESGVIL